jgi:hypothetical protein
MNVARNLNLLIIDNSEGWLTQTTTKELGRKKAMAL